MPISMSRLAASSSGAARSVAMIWSIAACVVDGKRTTITVATSVRVALMPATMLPPRRVSSAFSAPTVTPGLIASVAVLNEKGAPGNTGWPVR